MHFAKFLADVAQVADHLLTLGLRHRIENGSAYPFTPSPVRTLLFFAEPGFGLLIKASIHLR
jgi:hypothetical protein